MKGTPCPAQTLLRGALCFRLIASSQTRRDVCARVLPSAPSPKVGKAGVGTGGKDAPSKLAAMSAPCVRHGRANSPRDPPADAPWIMRLINRSCLSAFGLSKQDSTRTT
jgi:hypothetical protein